MTTLHIYIYTYAYAPVSPLYPPPPSIVVSGTEAFSEDGWEEITVGSLPMKMVKPCSRCKIPNIDSDTSTLGVEPGMTLRKYR